ncbi:hypothetical protein L2784_05920 [Lactobacillus crispatus]|mgnify:FL=1|uniref:Uncharacterized protein n=2 Tax=Bacteria TaxID=2 RepID=K1MFJ3_9LACO|nr:hypothetical protein [Lactobacillus crispatus]QRD99611.1 hypothetical protein [Lactobacillus phage vB_Lcr_AB1]DAO82290.1 MAG TPA: Protein of unknown function (DUF2612) [Bacteriophage sp.]DAX87139.1 MAG TPA: Protein of unknown function (DUF2612) [Caudoviricetes sp.]EFE00201.1 hypothetical protein HMPREF0891_0015 [Lactobacillus crispatus 214-1]EKB63062.1 hypothetical protein HMPREF9249_02095 [Lactobacillus crispatus FB077-07]
MAYETTDQLIAEVADHWNKKKDTVFYQLLDSYNSLLEKISDENEKIAEWRSIDKAKGTTLDLIGQDYKAYRISDDDETFRFIIFLHILISRAQGTIPSMVKILGTALNAKPEQFKVYKTGLRHVGIEIPWDNVQTLQMQKFIIKNIQNLLAMGYWIDEIVFVTTTKLPLYVGMGTQIKHRKIERSPVKWWTGWKARTSDKQYIGIATQFKHHNTLSSNTKWWTGWKAESTRSQFIGVVGQLAKSSVWATTAVWSKPQTAEIHAGLTIGNKTLTTTTQSIATE